MAKDRVKLPLSKYIEDVITCFNNMDNEKKFKFIQFDINSYYKPHFIK